MSGVVTVRLPDDLEKSLEKAAKRTRKSKSEIIKESLSLYLWEKDFEEMKNSLKPYAKKQGIVTEEDVFKEIS
ncbi:MAG: CopG family transcriptional regulator [Desulfurellaceae bacterium]|jgi:predicted transcriptional regulator|nr:CopG family transcriptional regulator [Desulfurellaceae bacterium]